MSNIIVPDLTDILFSTVLDVRIYDINYGNHLGHDSVVSFFHEARVRFLKTNGFTELDILGLGVLVTTLAVTYRNQSFYSDSIQINIGIGKISRTGADFIYQAKNSDEKREIARGLTTLTFYDYQKKKIAKMPEEFLSKISSNSML